MLQMSSSSDYERHKNNNNNNSSSSSGRSSRNKKKGAPFLFFTNILKKKKVLSIDEIKEMKTRTRSEPSVVSYSCSLPVGQPSISTLSLTPGRILSRDIDHDMQQLRLSRSDNPYLQKKLASRDEMNMIDMEDNLVDDDTILIQDLNSQIDSGFEPDPFLLPDVQEHMIRSPPPVSWRPHGSSVFNFPHDNNNTITSHSSEESTPSVHAFYAENFTSKQSSRISFDKIV